jgi:hypothetical protein
MPSRLQLRTPSGPQWTESELEAELVEQLNFSLHVVDIITQPIIRYVAGGKEHQYTPDVLVELNPDESGSPRYYLIEVKRKKNLADKYAEFQEKFAAARECAARNFGEFRPITETEIRTPYLFNARFFNRYLGALPHASETALIVDIVTAGATTAGALIATLRLTLGSEAAARLAVERAVANRLVACDFSQTFNDASILTNAVSGKPNNHDDDLILRLIRLANY